MADLIQKVKSILNDLEYEYQTISFEALIAGNELEILGKLKSLPDCESSKILKYLPTLYVFHRKAPPKKGSFFIQIDEADENIGVDRDSVLKKYLPKAILIVTQDKNGVLCAYWHHNKKAVTELELILEQGLK